jgi:peptidylprolyl isomerase
MKKYVEKQMTKLRAAHLLIKHQESRNPISRRTGQSTSNITREMAVTELREWLRRIKSGEITFEEAASQRSDCGSYRDGGDLGLFGPGEMMKPFEDATRALAVGEISDVVHTDSGCHIIKRLA